MLSQLTGNNAAEWGGLGRGSEVSVVTGTLSGRGRWVAAASGSRAASSFKWQSNMATILINVSTTLARGSSAAPS